ncbi:peptidoglycan bridge formation protein FemAB [Bifidobacterium samirii]|uniref:Peptidoglycan bridge formation protein FemAB n=1 Tax=Bifidobacterium samirii TaxID=2306974 RepID=A0A430FR93_9BIFI|nr:peptidoglycan bridge formation protein FemAB [Bifidobacterium samirii]
MMRRLASRPGVTVDLVGVADADDMPQAGAMLVVTPSRLGAEGSIWMGPLCDPHDRALMAAITDAIRRAAKRRGAYRVTCWPSDVYRRHRSDGTADGEPDEAMMATYAALGWRHGGFDVGYGSLINRWLYVKDLTGIADGKALLASYGKRTQWSVRRAAEMGVRVRELADDELGLFARIERRTAERRGFAARDEEYFRRVRRAFGDKVRFMVAEIHTADYLADMTAKRDRLAARVDDLAARYEARPTTRIERQLGEERRNLAAAGKRLDEAAVLAGKGDVLPAAVSMFIDHPRETVYFVSGSVEEYKPFYASALIQHEAMLRCIGTGVERYNFYGISGVFDDPSDEGRGVLEFKQGFNGYVEELPGAFTLPVDRVRFAVRDLAKRLLGR